MALRSKTSKAGTMGHAVFQLGDCARRDAFVIRVCSGDIVRDTMRGGSTLHVSSPKPAVLEHVRNAVARFDQVNDVSDEDRDLAFANSQKAARHYRVNLGMVGTIWASTVGRDEKRYQARCDVNRGGMK